MGKTQVTADFLFAKLEEAKNHFERALECKHTEFDDLYPYMVEHPHFYWYKRYVAWAELLTIVKLCSELEMDWTTHFTEIQVAYIRRRVLSAAVLDYWFEKEQVG